METFGSTHSTAISFVLDLNDGLLTNLNETVFIKNTFLFLVSLFSVIFIPCASIFFNFN